jgi:tetratricopeptide (TPR) repeat protein
MGPPNIRIVTGLEEEGTMKLLGRVFWLSALLLLIVANLSAAEVLTNEAVVTLVKAGLGAELIISKIKISPNAFDLSTNGILKLKSDGVNEGIIQAMVEASVKTGSSGTKPDQAGQEAQEREAIALYRQGRIPEAVSAFDRLIADKPGDDGLRIWKALALLEQARGMRDAKTSGFKPLVVNAYTILQPMGRSQAKNPDWNFAMAKAFWLNDRPTWARRAAGKALDLRPNFAEAHVLLGDLAYDDEVAPNPSLRDPRNPTTEWQSALASRKAYETTLAIADLSPNLRAEVLYKLGRVSEELEHKRASAREYWEKAVAADPDCRYGRLAQEKLTTVPAK